METLNKIFEYTAQNVVEFLNRIGITDDKIHQIFIREIIDGRALVILLTTEDGYRDLVEEYGISWKIIMEIKKHLKTKTT